MGDVEVQMQVSTSEKKVKKVKKTTKKTSTTTKDGSIEIQEQTTTETEIEGDVDGGKENSLPLASAIISDGETYTLFFHDKITLNQFAVLHP
jgi:hypothetical protein